MGSPPRANTLLRQNAVTSAMLFVALFVIQIRDSKNRETKYQTLINSLAEKLEIVELIKDDIEEIKQIVKKDDTTVIK